MNTKFPERRGRKETQSAQRNAWGSSPRPLRLFAPFAFLKLKLCLEGH